MSLYFATCERARALEFIRRVTKGDISDSPDSAGPLLDFVEKDIIRITDPMMHATAQVIPGTNWDESKRDEVVMACKVLG